MSLVVPSELVCVRLFLMTYGSQSFLDSRPSWVTWAFDEVLLEPTDSKMQSSNLHDEVTTTPSASDRYLRNATQSSMNFWCQGIKPLQTSESRVSRVRNHHTCFSLPVQYCTTCFHGTKPWNAPRGVLLVSIDRDILRVLPMRSCPSIVG